MTKIDYLIRPARAQDVPAMAKVESICFPPAEAAELATFKERFAAFPENFLVAEADGQVIGFVNGCSTNSDVLVDAMYHDPGLHCTRGRNITVFGLDVLPQYQRQGIAAALLRAFLERARQGGCQRALLTCKEHLLHYYAGFGFVSQGLSASSHGGAVWYAMSCDLTQSPDC